MMSNENKVNGISFAVDGSPSPANDTTSSFNSGAPLTPPPSYDAAPELDPVTEARLAAEKAYEEKDTPLDEQPEEPRRTVTGFQAILAMLLNAGHRTKAPSMQGATSIPKAHFNALDVANKQRKLVEAREALESSSSLLTNMLKERGYHERVMAELHSGGGTQYIEQVIANDPEIKKCLKTVNNDLNSFDGLLKDAVFLAQSTEKTEMNKQALESLEETIGLFSAKDIEDCPVMVKGKFESLKDSFNELIDQFKIDFKGIMESIFKVFSGNSRSASPKF